MIQAESNELSFHKKAPIKQSADATEVCTSLYPENELSTGKQNCQTTPETATSTPQGKIPSPKVKIFTCSRLESLKKIQPHIGESSLILRSLIALASQVPEITLYQQFQTKGALHHLPDVKFQPRPRHEMAWPDSEDPRLDTSSPARGMPDHPPSPSEQPQPTDKQLSNQH